MTEHDRSEWTTKAARLALRTLFPEGEAGILNARGELRRVSTADGRVLRQTPSGFEFSNADGSLNCVYDIRARSFHVKGESGLSSAFQALRRFEADVAAGGRSVRRETETTLRGAPSVAPRPYEFRLNRDQIEYTQPAGSSVIQMAEVLNELGELVAGRLIVDISDRRIYARESLPIIRHLHVQDLPMVVRDPDPPPADWFPVPNFRPIHESIEAREEFIQGGYPYVRARERIEAFENRLNSVGDLLRDERVRRDLSTLVTLARDTNRPNTPTENQRVNAAVTTATEILCEALRYAVDLRAADVAKLGEWPARVQSSRLAVRVPTSFEGTGEGFDAGIAVALGLIPAERAKLSAIMHANQTQAAVEQIVRETSAWDPSSETTWWLAACGVCREGKVGPDEFLDQVKDFGELIADPARRLEAAQDMFATKTSLNYPTAEFGACVPFDTTDGSLTAAYLKGHPVAVTYNAEYGIYFIGTYLEQGLGLENFAWSTLRDGQGRPCSGPVGGSNKFVKCANREEVQRALEVILPNFEGRLRTVDGPTKELNFADQY